MPQGRAPGNAVGAILGVLPGGGAWLLHSPPTLSRRSCQPGTARCPSARRRRSAPSPAPEIRQQRRHTDLVHPMLTLGDATTNAVMALMVAPRYQGATARPQVMTSVGPCSERGLIASMWIGNLKSCHPEPALIRDMDKAAWSPIASCFQRFWSAVPSDCTRQATTTSTSTWVSCSGPSVTYFSS